MFSEQRWRVQQELDRLKKLQQLEADPQQQQRLEQRISVLEQKLERLTRQEEQKATVHISQVDAGRDITVGGHHHHYYPEPPKQGPGGSPWLKISVGMLCLLFFVGGVLYWYTSSTAPTSPSTASTPSAKQLRIKLRDQAGQVALRSAGQVVLNNGNSELIAFIDSQGIAHFPFLENHTKLRFHLIANDHQLVFPNRIYHTDSSEILVLITPILPPPAKPPAKSKRPSPAALSFLINGPSPKAALALKKGLLQSTNWRSMISAETDLQIEIGHSGQYKKVSSNMHQYTPGYLQIHINGVLCCCEEERYRIELGGSKYGNPLHLIEERIIDTMYQQIHQHLEDVIVKIKNCAM